MPTETTLKIPGYELLDPIGRGGMGVVYRARDQRLDRDVAIKLLVEKAETNPAAAARFVVEAKITGQLQHPGIPAVHELGTLSDGRPFLAMKLVKGRTLQALLDENLSLTVGAQTSENNATDLSRDRQGAVPPDRGRFLAIFEHICHAVGYAHAHRVIHRDLKPSNIMVGAFGEVQVMDWGLAKVLEANPDRQGGDTDTAVTTAYHPVSEIETPDTPGSAPTRTGSILGTPSYMPPEQAGGEIRKLNQQSDVFGLGAILCQILTNRPPYQGRDSNEVRLLAVRGEMPEVLARLDRCGTEPDVVALCNKCLSFKQEDRPADGQTVAEAVANIRNQAEARARQAELERAQALVREAEQRKRRRVWIGLAASLLLGVFGLVVGLVFVVGLNRQLETANTQLAHANAELKERKRIADENFKLALDAVKAQVFDIDKELKNRAGTRDLREKLSKGATERLKKLVEQATTPRGERSEPRGSQSLTANNTAFSALINLGDVYQDVDGKLSLARNEYEKAHAIAQQLVAADPNDAQAQHDLSISCERLGDVTRQAGQLAQALQLFNLKFEIDKKRAAVNPRNTQAQRDLSISFDKLGDVGLQTGDATAAVKYYTDGLDIRKKLAAADPRDAQAQRDLSVSFDRLGNVSLQTGDATAAVKYYTDGLDIRKKLAAADPRDAQAQRDLSISFDKLGDVSLQTGNATAAVKHYTDGLDISEKLAAADPRDAQAQRDLSISCEKLGDVSLLIGNAIAAVKYYADGLDISKKLAAADPSDAKAQRDLSVAFIKLGNLSRQTGDTTAAVKYYADGLAISKKLAATDPRDAQAQRDSSVSFHKLGDVSLQTGDVTAALKYYTDGLAIRKKLAAADPRDAQAQTDLFIGYWALGEVEKGAGRYGTAVLWYRRGLDVLRPLHAAGKLHGQFKNGVAIVEKDIATCELLAKLSPGLIEDPAWPLLWGWPRH